MYGNLVCANCGADYYSASPKQAMETTLCDNCGTLSLVQVEGFNESDMADAQEDQKRHLRVVPDEDPPQTAA